MLGLMLGALVEYAIAGRSAFSAMGKKTGDHRLNLVSPRLWSLLVSRPDGRLERYTALMEFRFFDLARARRSFHTPCFRYSTPTARSFQARWGVSVTSAPVRSSATGGVRSQSQPPVSITSPTNRDGEDLPSSGLVADETKAAGGVLPPADEKPALRGYAQGPKRTFIQGRKFGFALRYEECDSFMHRLSGVTKFISFIIWIVFALTTFDIRFLIPATFVSFILLSLSKVPLSKFKPYIIGMLTIIGFNALFIFLFSPDQGTRYLGGQTLLLGSAHHRYALSAQTLFYLLVVSLKYFSIFHGPSLSLPILAFASALNRNRAVYRVSYAVALALRYLPEVTKNYPSHITGPMARVGTDCGRSLEAGSLQRASYPHGETAASVSSDHLR